MRRHLSKYKRLLKSKIALLFVAFFACLSFYTLFVNEKNENPTEDHQLQYLFKENYFSTPFKENLAIREPLFNNHTCSITDYGAKAGDKNSTTEAFGKAIEDCTRGGGGSVIIPKGTWLTGPIKLKNNINLHLEDEAKLVFSEKFEDYLPVVFSRFEGIEYYNYSPPIYAKDCKNVAITGNGTLDGQGENWWNLKNADSIQKIYAMGDDNTPLNQRIFDKPEYGIRPSFVEFVNCNSILVENVTLKNGPMWTVHPVYSKNITVRNVKIFTNPGPSTDGVAIDSSRDVVVENSTFNTGDDAIVLKSGRDKEGMRIHVPTENVVIRNNNVLDSHGAIAIGSETSGDIRNVYASNNNVDLSQYGFRIKSALGRGGIVENIWTENLRIKRASIDGIRIDAFYGTPFRVDSVAAPFFRNIYFKDIYAEKTSHPITIKGSYEKKVDSISFENIEFGTKKDISVENSSNINFNNVSFAQQKSSLFFIKNSSDINFEKIICHSSDVCLELNGSTTENINVSKSELAKNGKTIFGQGAKKEALILE